MYKKFGKWALLFIALDILVGVGMLVLGINHLPSPEKESEPVPVKTVHIPANCWNGGEGHPYPNQVMYDGEIRGQKVVDSVIREMFENRPGPYDPELVQYFCKG